MRISDLPKHSRPREKLAEKGLTALSDSELIAILLRTGYAGRSAVEVAQNLVTRHTLPKLLDMPLETLAKYKGIGLSRATTLKVVTEIAIRLQTTFSHTLETAEVAAKVVAYLAHKKQEHLVGLYLNARHQLIGQRTLTVGTLTTNLIHPREVFAPALELRAAGIILAHNHPSGTVEPSIDDIEATERLMDAGELLDIPIIDHLIIGSEKWLSFRQQRLL